MHRLPPLAQSATSAAAAAPSTSTPDVVAELGRILSTRRWNKGRAYKRLAPSVTAAHVADLFRADSAAPEPATALAFFEWLARRDGFRHTADSHAALLHLLSRRRAPAQYERLVVSMLNCSDTAEDMRVSAEAIQAIRRTGGARLALSPKCYNLALRSLARFDMTEYMGRVYSQLVQDGLLPDTVTYNTMIKSYCKEGDLTTAHRYFRLLLEGGLEPETFTFAGWYLWGHIVEPQKLVQQYND
uniref:Pentacotripeptide-repeat region of PRORP domain-containing protein n=1 Tax=Oryza meridionalis TaxID=40149 RepID=A0A0E0E5M1_9ORYZ